MSSGSHSENPAGGRATVPPPSNAPLITDPGPVSEDNFDIDTAVAGDGGHGISLGSARAQMGKVFDLRLGLRVLLDALVSLAAIHTQMTRRPSERCLGLIEATDVVLYADGVARLRDTRTGNAMSPHRTRSVYAAPELKLSARFDQQADIYSMGVLLWELLGGFKHEQRQMPPPAKARQDVLGDLPPWAWSLVGIVRTATAPQPEARFQSARQLHREIEKIGGDNIASRDEVATVVQDLGPGPSQPPEELDRPTFVAPVDEIPQEAKAVPKKPDAAAQQAAPAAAAPAHKPKAAIPKPAGRLPLPAGAGGGSAPKPIGAAKLPLPKAKARPGASADVHLAATADGAENQAHAQARQAVAEVGARKATPAPAKPPLPTKTAASAATAASEESASQVTAEKPAAVEAPVAQAKDVNATPVPEPAAPAAPNPAQRNEQPAPSDRASNAAVVFDAADGAGTSTGKRGWRREYTYTIIAALASLGFFLAYLFTGSDGSEEASDGANVAAPATPDSPKQPPPEKPETKDSEKSAKSSAEESSEPEPAGEPPPSAEAAPAKPPDEAGQAGAAAEIPATPPPVRRPKVRRKPRRYEPTGI